MGTAKKKSQECAADEAQFSGKIEIRVKHAFIKSMILGTWSPPCERSKIIQTSASHIARHCFANFSSAQRHRF